jgi:hypothetical protein
VTGRGSDSAEVGNKSPPAMKRNEYRFTKSDACLCYTSKQDLHVPFRLHT